MSLGFDFSDYLDENVDFDYENNKELNNTNLTEDNTFPLRNHSEDLYKNTHDSVSLIEDDSIEEKIIKIEKKIEYPIRNESFDSLRIKSEKRLFISFYDFISGTKKNTRFATNYGIYPIYWFNQKGKKVNSDISKLDIDLDTFKLIAEASKGKKIEDLVYLIKASHLINFNIIEQLDSRNPDFYPDKNLDLFLIRRKAVYPAYIKIKECLNFNLLRASKFLLQDYNQFKVAQIKLNLPTTNYHFYSLVGSLMPFLNYLEITSNSSKVFLNKIYSVLRALFDLIDFELNFPSSIIGKNNTSLIPIDDNKKNVTRYPSDRKDFLEDFGNLRLKARNLSFIPPSYIDPIELLKKDNGIPINMPYMKETKYLEYYEFNIPDDSNFVIDIPRKFYDPYSEYRSYKDSTKEDYCQLYKQSLTFEPENISHDLVEFIPDSLVKKSLIPDPKIDSTEITSPYTHNRLVEEITLWKIDSSGKPFPVKVKNPYHPDSKESKAHLQNIRTPDSDPYEPKFTSHKLPVKYSKTQVNLNLGKGKPKYKSKLDYN